MQAVLLAAVTTAKYFLVASNVTSDADFKSAINLMNVSFYLHDFYGIVHILMFSSARFGCQDSAKRCLCQAEKILSYGWSNGRILEALCEQLPKSHP